MWGVGVTCLQVGSKDSLECVCVCGGDSTPALKDGREITTVRGRVEEALPVLLRALYIPWCLSFLERESNSKVIVRLV